MLSEECIDKLENLILDENVVVTYKLLSKELKIHVNEAKKSLYEFLMIQKSKEENKLYAYYFVSGLISKEGEKVLKVAIVSEDNLEKVKEKFEEITSCHIYSLNNGGHLDASSLYSSQSWCKKWAEEHRQYSAVKHPNVVIQAPVIKKIEAKKDSKPSFSETSKGVQVKKETSPALFKKSNKTSANNTPVKDNKEVPESLKSSENNSDPAKSSNGLHSNSKEDKKNTLSSLWQKLEDKSKNEIGKPEAKGKAKNATKAVAKNNIMSMFSKQAEKNASNPIKKTNSLPVSESKTSPVKKEAEKVSPKISNKIEEKIDKKSKKRSTQKQVKRPSKQTSDNESEEDFKPKKKKHRRICTMDDSDSESENEEEQDKAQRNALATKEPEDVQMAVSDDSEEPIPPTPPVVNSKGKKKILKTINKTFEDEDGFLVSKQEKVFISGSESDEDPLPPKTTVVKTEPKQNTFLYRKQASLTSFFNKK